MKSALSNNPYSIWTQKTETDVISCDAFTIWISKRISIRDEYFSKCLSAVCAVEFFHLDGCEEWDECYGNWNRRASVASHNWIWKGLFFTDDSNTIASVCRDMVVIFDLILMNTSTQTSGGNILLSMFKGIHVDGLSYLSQRPLLNDSTTSFHFPTSIEKLSDIFELINHNSRLYSPWDGSH